VKREKTGFTLVELLTVLAIIALLVGLLIPSLTMIRNTAKKAKQKAQLTEIGLALTAFRNDHGDYPPSSWLAPGDYCGAQKLAEALLGWDLMGFHPDSHWQADGRNNMPITIGGTLYPVDGYFFYDTTNPLDMDKRKGIYLELATTNAFKLGDLYGPVLAASALSTSPDTFVICDSYGAKKITIAPGQTAKAGTPILYYRANTTNKTIDPAVLPQDRIYNVRDNMPLINQLQSVEENIANAQDHPLGMFIGGDYPVFYNARYNYGVGIGYGIRDPKVPAPWPYRPDSYILISAGMDGLYGTEDDICNFGN